MNRISLYVIVLVLLAACSASAQQLIVYPDDFPEAGHTVLVERFENAKIKSISKGYESRFGDVYRITGTINGERLEAMLDYEGALLEDLRIRTIPLKEVPAACIKAAKDQFPDLTFESAEKVTQEEAFKYRLYADMGVPNQQFVVNVSSECEVIDYYMAEEGGGL